MRSQVKILSLFATHFCNYPYPQSGCMSPELLNCLRTVYSKFYDKLTLTSCCELDWGMILKQSLRANSSRKFLGGCVLLLFILDSKAFGGNGTYKTLQRFDLERLFFHLNIASAFL